MSGDSSAGDSPSSSLDLAFELGSGTQTRNSGGSARWNRKYDLAVVFGDGLCAAASTGTDCSSQREPKGRIYSFQKPRSTTLLVESTEEQTTTSVQAGTASMRRPRTLASCSAWAMRWRLPELMNRVCEDTEAISTWGKVTLKSDTPQLIQIFTRSGNTVSPDKTWSDWSRVDGDGANRQSEGAFYPVESRLEGRFGTIAVAECRHVPYMQQNFRPEITSLDVLPFGVTLIKEQALTSTGRRRVPRMRRRLERQPVRACPALSRCRHGEPFRRARSPSNGWRSTRTRTHCSTILYYRADERDNWVLAEEERRRQLLYDQFGYASRRDLSGSPRRQRYCLEYAGNRPHRGARKPAVHDRQYGPGGDDKTGRNKPAGGSVLLSRRQT